MRIPAPERLYLLLALMISGTVTVPQVMEFGNISGLGYWTIAAAGITWALWLMKPRAPMAIMPAVIPLAAFTAVACLSPLWGGGFDSNAIQLLAVTVAFIGFLVLTAREVADRPYFAESLFNALDFASVTAAVFYTVTFLIYGMGGEMTIAGRPVFLARPFALFAIIAVARQLARFHAGDKAGLVIAVWLTGLVFLSQSRLGMITILAMYPLSFALLGGRKNVAMALTMLVFGVCAMTVLILSSPDMHRRFFGEDASMTVGGVSINASGRTTAWTALLNDINGTTRLLFGAGAGAGSLFCQLNLHNFPHPHNDYLRYLFDFGLVGLLWFIAFVVIAIRMVWVRVRADRLNVDANAFARSYATVLAMVGVLASMATDNSGIYIYVMAPLGVMLGVTLCRAPSGTRRAQNLDWVFAGEAPTADPPTTQTRRTPARVPKRAVRR